MNSGFKDRLKQERLSLEERLETLEAFIQHSPVYADMDYKHRDLLDQQLEAMRAYLDILHQRWSLLKKKRSSSSVGVSGNEYRHG